MLLKDNIQRLLKIEFMQISLYYISGLNQEIEEHVFSFEFVSKSSFSNRHQISNNTNLEISLWRHFPAKTTKI